MRTVFVRLAVAAGILAPLAGGAEPREDVRPDLDALGALLERAVDRVSHPGAVPMVGGHECRGYRIQGVGVVFVIPPRALHRPGSVFMLQRRSIGTGPGRAPLPPDAETAQQIALIEAQADEMTREASKARQEAERALEQISLQIRARLAVQAPSRGPSPAPEASPVADPGTRSLAQPPEAPVPPAAPAAPAPPEAPLPPVPPWSYWFDTPDEPDEVRAPDAVVAQVKEVVTTVIEGNGSRLRVLRPEELVIAAVDFVDGALFAGRSQPERTLVIRVKKKDLDERQGGRLSAEELRRRIDYLEY
jgi:hypothetical protein